MRVLVTGSEGRIGRRLVERLEATEGSVVIAASRSDRRSVQRGRLDLDLLDPASLADAVEVARPDAVVHLASRVGTDCEVDPELAWRANVIATEQLATAARAFGAFRFVFASTAAVYGDGYRRPVVEEDELAGRSVYAETKRSAEIAVSATADSRMSAVVLRIFNVWGEGFAESLPCRLLRSTRASAVTLRGMDGFVRDYVHVDDVVDAITRAVEIRATHPVTTLNIGRGIAVSNRSLLERLSIPLDRVRVEAAAESWSVADVSAAQKQLAFSADRAIGSVQRSG